MLDTRCGDDRVHGCYLLLHSLPPNSKHGCQGLRRLPVDLETESSTDDEALAVAQRLPGGLDGAGAKRTRQPRNRDAWRESEVVEAPGGHAGSSPPSRPEITSAMVVKPRLIEDAGVARQQRTNVEALD